MVGLGIGGRSRMRRLPSSLVTLRGIMSDPAVQIAGRDGSMSLANPGCTFLDPPTGAAISANRAYNLVGPGGLVLPMYTAFPAATNLFLNAQAPATQDINVVTGSVLVTALGSGYTLETAANTATGSGFGVITLGTPQVLTITGNGSITLTIAGTPVGATVQVQAGALRTPLIVTAGASATRAADANVWTLPDALGQTEDIIVLTAQCYASGDMGVSVQTWLKANDGGAESTFVRTSATEFNAAATDSGLKTDTVTRTIPNARVIFTQMERRTPSALEGGFGKAFTGSPTAGGAWGAVTAFRIGNGTTAGRDSYALNACIRRKGGFSQAQIDALYYGFANGRTVPVVA